VAVNQYVILSNTGNIAGGKKIYVRLNTWVETARSVNSRATLSDKSYGVLSAGRPAWVFTILAAATAWSGYFTKDEILAYYNSTTASTFLWKFQDIFGNVIDAMPEGTIAFRPALAPVLDGADGWFEAEMRLRRR